MLEKLNSLTEAERNDAVAALHTREAYLSEVQDERKRLEDENSELNKRLERMQELQRNLDIFESNKSAGTHSRQVRK